MYRIPNIDLIGFDNREESVRKFLRYFSKQKEGKFVMITLVALTTLFLTLHQK